MEAAGADGDIGAGKNGVAILAALREVDSNRSGT